MQSALSATTDRLMLANGLAFTRMARQSAQPDANALCSRYLEWHLSGKAMAAGRLWSELSFCHKSRCVVEELTVNKDVEPGYRQGAVAISQQSQGQLEEAVLTLRRKLHL